MNDQPECTDYAVAGTKFGTVSCELGGDADYRVLREPLNWGAWFTSLKTCSGIPFASPVKKDSV